MFQIYIWVIITTLCAFQWQLLVNIVKPILDYPYISIGDNSRESNKWVGRKQEILLPGKFIF